MNDTPLPAADPNSARARLGAFCWPGAPEIFHSIVYQPQIWSADPFDVETIHAAAREAFDRLLRRAASEPPPKSGRILLLHGEAGSGKTHLMRAFRQATHADGTGYFGYLQMTTEVGNYGRYVLGNLVDSLDQPYLPPQFETSGLMRLSTGLFEAIPGLLPEEREVFRESSIAELSSLVHEYADRAMSDARLAACDIDLIRAMIYLQRGDAAIKTKVLKWLRCEDLSAHDRTALGDLVPRTQDEHPVQMIARLGRMMAALYAAPLVICVDQLEDIFHMEMAAERFRRVVDTMVALADAVPTAVVVIACLEDYYAANRQHLTRTKLDRLELDPEPIRLTGYRAVEEIAALVARRVESLYESAGVDVDPATPTFPFRWEHLAPLANLSTRKVLDFCREHHHQCIVAGAWVEPGPPEPEVIEVNEPPFSFEPTWNDTRASFRGAIPGDEPGLAALLTWAIDECTVELPTGYRFHAKTFGRLVPVRGMGSAHANERLLVAVSEKSAVGGGLGRQVKEAEVKAQGAPVVLVRSTAFPTNPKTQIAKQIGQIVAKGGRRVTVEDADWRALAAFREFHAAYHADPAFEPWQRDSRPLSQLAALHKILALDRLPAPAAVVTPSPAKVVVVTPAATATMAAPARVPILTAPKVAPAAATETGPLLLGSTKGLTSSPVHFEPMELRQHMAFLGGPGSGKTTAALSLIEQLLLRGVPAILLDRKGDLSRYADPAAWADAAADPDAAARLAALRDCADVALYTPGDPNGRPLAIAVVPDRLDQLPTADRERTAGFAAAALGGMMGHKPAKPADQVGQAILTKAIEVLSAQPGRAVTVDALNELVERQDDALLNAVGGYEPKHYKKLAQDLLTLKLQHKRLLVADGAETLDVDALLGPSATLRAGRPGVSTGKTRLTIINTQSLGAAAAVDFWVAQFLIALDRWRVRSPSEHLQAVVLLDEADQYLPAVRQPATKAPLESLLRRARSAGLGLFLATQSPGDLDYRCRDQIRAWLIGRVKEPVALAKLKPMFSDARLDVAARLPGQATGEFYLVREREVVPLRTERSLVETKQLPEQRIVELARMGRR